MEQLTCVGPNRLEWRDVPVPRLENDSQLIVRPLAVARCEIDPILISAANADGPHFSVGHECVAEVVECGDGVSAFAPGDRVIPSFQLSCGGCTRCRRGHTANCEAYPVLSDYGMAPLSGVDYGGMLSDRVRVPHPNAMLQRVPAGLDPIALASAADNVLDGYRTVAPHLQATPGAEVLVVCHATPSIALYAVQSALALGAARVHFASDRTEWLRHAEKLGATPIETDFSRPTDRFPIVADCGVRPEGLLYAIRATEPEGVCHSASFYAGSEIALPMGRLYTLGIRFFIGRANSAALLPEVLSLIERGALAPEAVTTRVARWEDAAEAYLEASTKLVVSRL